MNKIYIVFLSIFLICVFTSTCIIEEGYQGILLRFGYIVQDDKNKAVTYLPGIHFRLPFIESIKKIDTRIQTTNYLTCEYFIKRKKFFVIENYIKWKVSDLHLNYARTKGNNVFLLKSLLKNHVKNLYQTKFYTLKIRDIMIYAQKKIFKKLYQMNNISKLGIEIVDIGTKNIQLSHDVIERIYNDMKKMQETISINQFLCIQKEFKTYQSIINNNVINFLFKRYH